MRKSLVIATRGSQLALWQAEHVKSRLLALDPELCIDLSIIKTKGDIIQDVPLAKVGGKGLFVKEIEEALLEDRADLAATPDADELALFRRTVGSTRPIRGDNRAELDPPRPAPVRRTLQAEDEAPVPARPRADQDPLLAAYAGVVPLRDSGRAEIDAPRRQARNPGTETATAVQRPDAIVLPADADLRERLALAGYGLVAGLAYGLVMNLWFWPFISDIDANGVPGSLDYIPGAPIGENLTRFGWFTLITSTGGWDTGRAITTSLAILILGRPVLTVLRRASWMARIAAPAKTG
mgnify:CR=1 FL=1